MIAGVALGDQWKESDYRDALCEGMRMEVTLPKQSRADCVSDTHAIEVEFDNKWKEAVGQALTYAQQTELIPGIILICRRAESKCRDASLFIQETFLAYGIEATIWECSASDRTLADCVEKWVCKGGGCSD
ncbi:MAG: hypothetical protein EOP22_02670 [Hyphomicrobiales bacterium]|nr:MAG: hypothetical protein EOP22_02670 [Hyphomicrobiales bacterium]